MKKPYCSLLATIACLTALVPQAQTYTWKQVRIGGSGAIPSFVVHPKVPDLYFITTDVGSPYRWNKNLQQWEPLMLFDQIPVNYWGWEFNQRCGSLAVDPRDTTGNILYATVENGKGTSPGYASSTGTVLKSINRGNSWTDLQVPIEVHPNKTQAYSERIQVDPVNSNVVWVVTDNSGVWRSADAGTHWTKLNQVRMQPQQFCSFIIFDTSAGYSIVQGQHVSKRIYIGRKDGIDVSEDGGQTFSLLPGSPAGANRATIHGDGTLYVSAFEWQVKKGVYRFRHGSWQDISPLQLSMSDRRSFAKVAIHPANSNQIVVGTGWGWQSDVYYLSKDGGTTYQAGHMTRDNTEAPHSFTDMPATGAPAHSAYSYTWDPSYPNRVWINDQLDVLSTDNIFAPTQHWKVRVKGLEEIMVTGPMTAPPSGKNLLHTVTADVAGADHRSLTAPLHTGAFITSSLFYDLHLGLNSQSVAYQYTDPAFIVRIASDGWGNPDKDHIGLSRSGYSLNGGDTYTAFPTSPGLRGRVAVSAHSKRIVWMTQWDANGTPGNVYWSDNLGTTWTRSVGAPSGTLAWGSQWNLHPGENHLVADKANGDFFYIWDRGQFYVSSDGGQSFQPAAAHGLAANNGNHPTNGTALASPSNVEVTPGKTGDVWISYNNSSFPDQSGLFHTIDTGRTFMRVGGKHFTPKWISVALSDTTPKAHVVLYVTSASSPINGICFGAFRSDDLGRTWTTIAKRLPGTVPNITADNHGRLFVSASGNGIFFGSEKTTIRDTSINRSY